MNSVQDNNDFKLLHCLLEASKLNPFLNLSLPKVNVLVPQYLERDRRRYSASDLPAQIKQAIGMSQRHKLIKVVDGVLCNMANKHTIPDLNRK